MTAFLEQVLRMRLLKVTGADLRRRDMGRDRQHRHPRPVAVEQAIDEVQIARSAAARAHREFTCQVRLGAGSEGGNFLVPDMDPLDLALTANGIRQTIETIADDAIDPLDARGGQCCCELVCYRVCH